jgi:hypothetical protein
MSSSGPLYGDGTIGAGCDPSFGPPCPSFFATSGGDVLIDSYNSTLGFGEIVVDSSVPEPSTLMLLTTGTLAAAGFIRRKIISVP